MNKFLVVFSVILVPIMAQGNVNVVQDTLGNYNVNVESPEISRNEERFEDGHIVGSYSYIDNKGTRHTINYVSGANQGYQATGDLPVAPLPVRDTPEVAKAREEFLALYHKEQNRAPAPSVVRHDSPMSIDSVLAQLVVPKIASLPASDVPEVDAEHYAIKADLLKAYATNLERLAQEYRNHQ